ncbi:Wzz/FepE/Etk N-terminal domain-containing protein [Serpentinicella sp. ANB-PHB4]|uniref:GumC family protein n=1 Tax=Serpentinicella sp. ANB-PHB4 TaxID=3074076 RepID=UPI00285E6F08|nr:Wzz/FepE/Etk N-terminal domain-containing protein [Serpentinicella sp. ANB-PHB4]MDR5658772.1 Wzz/FepE/Etk N-terminal domain-containing protein [Serpentinicella sp. ANB-PHB4]
MEREMEQEISLRELIEIVIKRKVLIAIVTLIAVVMSVFYSFVIVTPVYETKMVLMASNFVDRVQPNRIDGDINTLLDSVSRYPSMTLETFRQQIMSPVVMKQTIKDLGLEEQYDHERLARNINLETVSDTNLITISMRHSDPEQAARIVNQLGKNFVSFVSKNAQGHATKSSEFILNQMTNERQQLEEALDELKDFLSEPRGVSELTMELEARLEQITNFKTSLTDAQIRREALKASIDVAEAQAQTRDQMIVRNNNEAEEDTTTSFSNTQSITLENTETILKVELAEVEANINQFQRHITQLQSEIEEIQIELQDKRYQQRLIEQRVDLAQNTYDAFVKKYEELRVAESTEIGEQTISVISEAYPSSIPTGPNKTLNIAIALVLGVMLGGFLAFFIEYWESTGKDKEEEKASQVTH